MLIKEFNALAWWFENFQRKHYFQFSKMAFDLFIISTMFASIKKIFSECKLTCLQHANLLETLKNLHFLHSWLRFTMFENISLINYFCFKNTMLIIFNQINYLMNFLAVCKPLKKPKIKLIIEIAETAAKFNHSVSNMKRTYKTEYKHYWKKYCYTSSM